MGKLLLESLEIQNFRGFRQLQIEKLGRVNLIVGKNNIGKTSLLEALELYAKRGTPELIRQFLRSRNELQMMKPETEAERFLDALKYLFYGMEEIKGDSLSIHIGPADAIDETLTVSLNWYHITQQIIQQPVLFDFDTVEQQDEAAQLRSLPSEELPLVDNSVPRFTIILGQQKVTYSLFQTYRDSARNAKTKLPGVNCVSIKANGLSENLAISLWDKVTLTDMEEEVINALRLIAPGVKGLSFVGRSGTSRNPVPYVRIEDVGEPLPLGNLGSGMFRLLGIVLAMANAKDGILLIDEIENGVHYSVQPELWELIFRLARRLNVQVFATTHSWDSVEGLQQAAKKDNQEEGMLIRLALQGKDDIKVTLFDERRMEIAVRERIEIR